MYELVDSIEDAPVIRLVGVGGVGGETVRRVAAAGLEGVDVVCVDTDVRTLRSAVGRDVDFGLGLTRGLGTGGDASTGREAATVDRDRLRELVRDTDLLFIVAGTGGGTGNGAAPEIARLARERGVLTIALAIPPHPSAGAERMRIAERGIEALRHQADSMIVLPADEPWSTNRDASPTGVAATGGDAARTAVWAIVELINQPSLVGVDFSDVATVLRGSGSATAVRGTGRGEGRATRAVEEALCGLRLDGVDPRETHGFLVNIVGGRDLDVLREFEEACDRLRPAVSDEATVVVGTFVDDGLDGEVRVTVIAAGLAPGSLAGFVTRALPVTRANGWRATTDADERRHHEDDPRAMALARSAALTVSGPTDKRFGGAACATGHDL